MDSRSRLTGRENLLETRRPLCALVTLCFVLLLAAGCGGDSGGGAPGVDSAKKSEEALDSEISSVNNAEAASSDMFFETESNIAPDTWPNTSSSCDEACSTGPCVLHLGEMACPPDCAQATFGWDCGDPGDSPPDPGLVVAKSHFPHLCRPCLSSLDCADDFQSDDKCVAVSEHGRFCGTGCDEDAECPPDYLCRDSLTAEGGHRQQCVHKDEVGCGCTSVWNDEGASTVCLLVNDFGSCLGLKVCAPGVPFTCQGTPPAEEIADGLDQDCDDEIDEDICLCGDGICDQLCEETLEGCPYDCKVCGDLICSPSESPADCAADCCGACGDGQCIGYACGENPTSCPADCGNACGNDICEQGENPVDCAQDCDHQVCGNGICEGTDGGVEECPGDCGQFCGNCTCEGGESFFDCPLDCGYCGDGICSPCASLAETSFTCSADCCLETPETCGNGKDDDCDGETDEEDAFGCLTYYLDSDQDGAGQNGEIRCLCSPDGDYSALAGGDCDDTNGKVLYGQFEACNGKDDDCDGNTDEDFAVGESCSPAPGGVCWQGIVGCKDGKSTECKDGPPAPDITVCLPYSCMGATLQLAGMCNKGSCSSSTPFMSCGAYSCDNNGVLCRTSCSKDEHCNSGYDCDNTTCAPD